MIKPEFHIEPLLKYFPALLLYAELHFRFKWIGSRYYQKEPEILSDIPLRIEPGNDIPVLLIIKDSHLFSINLQEVNVRIYQLDAIIKTYNKTYQIPISTNWWDDTLFIEVNKLYGNIEVDVEFIYEINGINKTCHIHNYPLSSYHKMKTYLSEFQYPNDGNVIYGDIHYHSNLTEDMVEFGASIKATLLLARAMGLDFFCNTDHSYDLDDVPGSWTETDPKLEKWNNSRQEIKELNAKNSGSSFVIPSEELSLHNMDGRNIHALILNNEDFLPGAGDGAEKPFNFKSDYNTKNVSDNLSNNSLYIAAHPFTPVPLFQWLLFKRGNWKWKDILAENMVGLQIVNGTYDKGFYQGLSIWVKLLLAGYHKYIYAGNDAHGNFNIYRQIKIPMLSLFEKKSQLFGQFRTGVFTKNNARGIIPTISSMKNGNCFVTNGAFLKMVCQANNSIFNMGSIVHYNNGILQISISSTPEFGKINNIIIKKGIIGENKESNYFTTINLKKYNFVHEFEIFTEINCYFRCETELEYLGDIKNTAFSNPIWFCPVSK